LCHRQGNDSASKDNLKKEKQGKSYRNTERLSLENKEIKILKEEKTNNYKILIK
jgi:hypothetical protein